jgi:hypothetical protein
LNDLSQLEHRSKPCTNPQDRRTKLPTGQATWFGRAYIIQVSRAGRRRHFEWEIEALEICSLTGFICQMHDLIDSAGKVAL